MHTVQYSAHLFIAEGFSDLDGWLLEQQSEGRVPLARQGNKWIFEKYIHQGSYYEPQLPWRLLCAFSCIDVDRKRVVHISPNVDWVNVVKPGDTLELYVPNWRECCGLFVVSRIAKTMIPEIGQDELNDWCPGADTEMMIRTLNEFYGTSLNQYSQVALFRLRHINDIDKAYEPLLLVDGNGEDS